MYLFIHYKYSVLQFYNQRFIDMSTEKNTSASLEGKTNNKKMTRATEYDDEMLCGAVFCHPLWLQRCGNITTYSAFYGLTVLVTNALNVYVSSQITTLEKQFDFSSSQSGFILSCNDIGFILTVLFVSHFGIR